MKEKKLNFESFPEFTAYHEAAHFVLALLLNKFNKDFEKPISATIRVKENEPYGKNYITFKSPYLPETSKDLEIKDKNVRIKNIQNIFGEYFMLLSGYNSYRVFFEENKSFIKDIMYENKLTRDTKIESYTIEERLKENRFECESNNDIYRVSDLIRKSLIIAENYDHDDVVRDKLLSIFKFVFNELNKLMKNEAAVKYAIEITKDELLKNNSEVIEGKDLNDLIANAEGLIVNVDITEYLDACEKAYRNDDWYIPLQLPSNWVD